MIEEVVAVGQHHAAVQHHQIAVGLGGIDLKVLIRRLLVMQLVADLEREGAAVAVEDFGEPGAIEMFGHENPHKGYRSRISRYE